MLIVIRAEIEADTVFDMLSSIDDRKAFDKIKDKALEKHREFGYKDQDFNLNTVFIRLEGVYQVIIALVDADKFEGYNNYVVRRPHVQVCVKERDCIKSIAII